MLVVVERGLCNPVEAAREQCSSGQPQAQARQRQTVQSCRSGSAEQRRAAQKLLQLVKQWLRGAVYCEYTHKENKGARVGRSVGICVLQVLTRESEVLQAARQACAKKG